jgi:Protein of unknown function (DUF2804)
VPLHKAWTWIGAFGPELMLCAAVARVGPARASWWAVWDGQRLHERTHRRLAPVELTPRRISVREVLDLHVEPGAPWHASDAVSWTTKRPAAVHGSALGRPVALAGLIDQSGGRHARRTAWWWCAGAGVLQDGRPVTWNLVDGLHDGAQRSERAVWIGGVPRHVPPQPFHGFAGVGELRFSALAARARREDYGVIASDYEQPFGVFAGTLPEAGPLRSGFGVMERHRARW